MNSVAFIAARMGSERMPGKVLRELSGIPSLVHIFRIMSESKLTNGFAVVTTTLSEDDVIEDLCRRHSVACYRGSVHDVLDRFRIAVEAEEPDNVIRVTGDDPLMDPKVIDRVISSHIEGGYDYTSNMIDRTYPRGMDTEVVRTQALKYAWTHTADKDDREHVTLYIRRHPEMFTMQNVSCGLGKYEHIRLCLDTESDYNLLSAIYNELFDGSTIELESVLDLLERRPELLKLNEEIKQKTVKGKIY